MPPDEPPLAEGTGVGPLRVLVAMPTPLQCTLVRFFLDEAGFEILPMVPVGADVIPLAAGDRPEALVLHERFAVHERAGLVQGVRRVSPSSKIVVLTQRPEEAWRGPSRGADAYLEEWTGIANLEGILSQLCRGVSGPCDATSDHELEALDGIFPPPREARLAVFWDRGESRSLHRDALSQRGRHAGPLHQ